jgi:hypothetical protein
MFSFRMVLADGSPADPPQFVSAVPTWNVGDRVVVCAQPRYRITATEYDERSDTTTWIVEPVPSGH